MSSLEKILERTGTVPFKGVWSLPGSGLTQQPIAWVTLASPVVLHLSLSGESAETSTLKDVSLKPILHLKSGIPSGMSDYRSEAGDRPKLEYLASS